MNYKEFLPANDLRSLIKCYYIFEPDGTSVFEDCAYATGCTEIMFNLGEGIWQVDNGNGITTNPLVELWGQIIQPLPFQSIGKNSMLGVRFFPYSASFFLNEDISGFNNRITDFSDVAGNAVKELHSKILEETSLQLRIEHLNTFFLRKLASFEQKLKKVALIKTVMAELNQNDFKDTITNVATRYGISSRYLQKIFVQHTGLTPGLYNRINRFQNSLQLIASKNQSLTSIAYECGYFDQSHFIREFKSFTGKNPSAFNTVNSSAILASPNK